MYITPICFRWMRINFSGEAVGGELKTHEDNESLQAKWFNLQEVIECKITLRYLPNFGHNENV